MLFWCFLITLRDKVSQRSKFAHAHLRYNVLTWLLHPAFQLQRPTELIGCGADVGFLAALIRAQH